MNILSQKYLKAAERKVAGMVRHGHVSNGRQRMIGADGWLQRQMMMTGNVERGQFFPADGQAAPAAAQGGYSQAIVLQISNSSASSTSINLWGASVYLDQSTYTWTAGSLVQGTVTISVISTVGAAGFNTYYSALQQAQVMTIAKTSIQVIAGPNSQISQTWGLNTFATNANFAGQQFVNIPSPSQFRNDTIDNYQQMDLDPSTYLTVPILGSSVFLMLFYPLVNVNQSRTLIGQPQTKMFAPPPGNLPPQPVVVQQ